MDQKILQALREKAQDSRISCTDARRLAGELNVPVREIGRAADELKIKITACELGCF